MNEAQFTARVIDTARPYGWLVTHFRPAKTEKGWRTPLQGDSGFVDLVPGPQRSRDPLAELKVGREKPPTRSGVLGAASARATGSGTPWTWPIDHLRAALVAISPTHDFCPDAGSRAE